MNKTSVCRNPIVERIEQHARNRLDQAHYQLFNWDAAIAYLLCENLYQLHEIKEALERWKPKQETDNTFPLGPAPSAD